jgi:hypothetical protein
MVKLWACTYNNNTDIDVIIVPSFILLIISVTVYLNEYNDIDFRKIKLILIHLKLMMGEVMKNDNHQ